MRSGVAAVAVTISTSSLGDVVVWECAARYVHVPSAEWADCPPLCWSARVVVVTLGTAPRSPLSRMTTAAVLMVLGLGGCTDRGDSADTTTTVAQAPVPDIDVAAITRGWDWSATGGRDVDDGLHASTRLC